MCTSKLLAIMQECLLLYDKKLLTRVAGHPYCAIRKPVFLRQESLQSCRKKATPGENAASMRQKETICDVGKPTWGKDVCIRMGRKFDALFSICSFETKILFGLFLLLGRLCQLQFSLQECLSVLCAVRRAYGPDGVLECGWTS